jgi:hypothetical protein
MPKEKVGLILPLSTHKHPQPSAEPGLIIPRAHNLPEDVIPAGHFQRQTDSGLSIVTQQAPPPLQAYTEADIPQQTKEEQDKKTSEQLVPLYVWLESPLGALHNLAAQKNNQPALSLIRRAQESRATIREEVHKEEHEPEEKRKLHDALDSFFADALYDSRPVLTEDKSKVLAQLTEVADLLRFQTQTMTLRGNHTVEAATRLITDEDVSLTPDLLDFLTRFDIPVSLAGELLSHMDKTHRLTHPLAWHLFDKLPDDHQFKQDQRDRVQILKNLLTGEITDEKLAIARRVGRDIISVYVDPDSIDNKDKVGLELETVPQHIVTVPEGTTMGQDGYILNDHHLPELRLNTDDEILTYGKTWRQRYYNLYLWSEATQAEDKSLHIHINRNPEIQLGLYKILFGIDGDLVTYNSLGTIEIKRTTLAGYNKKIEQGARGFSSEYMPDLVELMYSLRQTKISPISLESLDTDRFTFFTNLVSDPTARAAMLLALRGEAGRRVINPKGLHNKFSTLHLHFATTNIGVFDQASQEYIVTNVCNSRNHTALFQLTESLGAMNPALHELVVDSVLQFREPITLDALCGNIGVLSPTLQERVITAMTKESAGNISVLLQKIDPSISLFTPQLQQRLLTFLIDYGNQGEAIKRIGSHFTTLDTEVRSNYLKLALEDKNRFALEGLARVVGDLDPELQKRVVNSMIEWGNFELSQIAKLPANLQKRIMTYVIGKNYASSLSEIGRRISSLDSDVQTEYFTWTFTKADRASQRAVLEGLVQVVGELDPHTQEQVVKLGINSHAIHIVFHLTNNLASLTPELQQDVISESIKLRLFEQLGPYITILTPDEQREVIEKVITFKFDTALEKIIEHIAELTPDLQKSIIAGCFSKTSKDIYAHRIADIAQHIVELDPTNQEYLLSQFEPAGLSYKSVSSNLPRWRYTLAA